MTLFNYGSLTPSGAHPVACKCLSTETAFQVASEAIQIHGGNGVTREFIVERLVREAIICPIPDGTTEIQKLIVSRALTGVAAFR